MSADWKSTNEYWENRYRQGQTGWDRGEVHPALLDWLSRKELRRCQTLIPGCGNGYEVMHLAALGFQVTAIDFAESPIHSLGNRLTENNLIAELVQADIFQWNSTFTFDAIYEQTCLCAIEPASRTHYETSILQWLKPGGKLYALFMQTPNSESGPPFHCDYEEMKKLFPESRWNWSRAMGTRYPHPAGTIHELAVCLVKR